MELGEILVFIVVAILQTILYVLYCGNKEKVFSFKQAIGNGSGENFKDENNENLNDDLNIKKDVQVYNKWQSLCWIILSMTVFFLSSFYLMKNIAGWNNFVKFSVITLIIASAATIDLRTRRIPNVLIAFGLAVRVIMYVVELVFFSEDVLSIFINDMIGFAIGFGILFLAAIISKGSVGFGDVKLFAVIGLFGGAILTYSTLLAALIFNTIASVVIIIVKKKNRKTAIPFGPAIFAGYLIGLCLSSF